MNRLILLVLLFVPTIVPAQNFAPFRARYLGSTVHTINQTLTASDTITLTNYGTIYSLSINATIQQPSEGSFVRIVMEDTDGHDYLVAESDWFRNDTTVVSLSAYCEETALLSGVTPALLKCYLTNATLAIHSLTTALSRANQAPGTTSPNELKRQQVQSIVDRINSYNERHGKLWVAGVTDKALINYTGNDSVIYNDSYLNNIKYYVDGFYELGERPIHQPTSISSYIKSFDWRKRHGKNWITSIKNQDPSGFCTAFAAVAVAESAAKLFFNTQDEIDLSEYAVGYYSGVNYNFGINTNWKHYPIQYIRDHGAIDEQTIPFPDHYIPLPEVCPQGNECIKIYDYITIDASAENVDSIKHYLIHKGPAQSGLKNSNHNHAMALIGYGEINADSIYHFIYKYNKDTTFAQTSPMIGKDFWIFKNSYGINDVYGHQGYAYYIFNDYVYMHEAFYPLTPISSLKYTIESINITDYDGDGYFNWGIGPRPAHCPAWAPEEPDGDDSDFTKGPMNEYGYCQELDSLRKKYVYIENDTTFAPYMPVHDHVVIWKGATVKTEHDVIFEDGTELIVDSGATLIVEDLLKNVTLRAMPGSNIIVRNNSKIVPYGRSDFDILQGVTFKMGLNTEIKYQP